MASVSFAPLPTGSHGFEVEGSDVVKLVLQFLHEQGLSKAAGALQAESGVALNVVDNKESFAADIRHGRWEVVLPAVGRMKLPASVMSALYEQVVVELLECREVELAKEMLRAAPPLQLLRASDPERFVALDQLCGRPVFDAAVAYGQAGKDSSSSSSSADGAGGNVGKKAGKERRRAALADALLPHVSQTPPARLLALVGQALKWQESNGLTSLPKTGQYDLFRGAARAIASLGSGGSKDGGGGLGGGRGNERAVRRLAGSVRFGSGCHAECAVWAPDGASLVSGSVDGLVEVWDPLTCQLRRDLPYQAVVDEERFMAHDGAIHALAFTKDGELLASAAADGKIKVWRMSTGKRNKLFDAAHQSPVTSLVFSNDNGQLLTASLDGTAKLLGLKSGSTLREFRGHSSFVHTALFADKECHSCLTGSADGTVKVWDTRSGACLSTFALGLSPPDTAVVSLLKIPDAAAATLLEVAPGDLSAVASSTGAEPEKKAGPLFLACGRWHSAHVVDITGRVVRTLSTGIATAPSTGGAQGNCFVKAALSPAGKLAYLAAEDGKVYCFDLASSQLEQTFAAVNGAAAGADSSGDQPAAKKAKVAASGATSSEVLSLVHHPHRNLVASAALDGQLKLWRA